MLKNIILFGGLILAVFFNYELCTQCFFKYWNVYLGFLYERYFKERMFGGEKIPYFEEGYTKKIRTEPR